MSLIENDAPRRVASQHCQKVNRQPKAHALPFLTTFHFCEDACSEILHIIVHGPDESSLLVSKTSTEPLSKDRSCPIADLSRKTQSHFRASRHAMIAGRCKSKPRPPLKKRWMPHNNKRKSLSLVILFSFDPSTMEFGMATQGQVSTAWRRVPIKTNDETMVLGH